MIQRIQLPLQTLCMIAAFIVWVLLSPLIAFIKEDIVLSAGQIAWITAIPVLLGSVLRIPVGYFTNRYGARVMFFISFVVLLVPVFYVSQADSFLDLFIGNLFIGIAGATFSIGVTSVPKYYAKERHGFVNGIYGVGNIGTAITAFSAPVLARQFGWSTTIQLSMGLLAVFALLIFLFGDRHETKVTTPLMKQMKEVYKNQKLWFLSLFYFITFGSFVAFTVYLPNFLVDYFGLDKVDAGLRTAGYIALATFIRPLGGWLADRWNPYHILMVVFLGLTASGVLLSFSPNIELYTIGALSIAACAGVGNGTVFKLVPLYFSKQAGVVNGLVSAMGGLGGFFPPLVLSTVYEITGHYAIGFMALSQFALVSFVIVLWMFYQDKMFLATQVIEGTVEGVLITDLKGKIVSVNPAFTKVTGYSPEEVIGKEPRILNSGIHGKEFYEKMWKDITENGQWTGEIWNKRKNGEIYQQLLTISSIKNEAGELKNYAGMFSDITQMKNKIS